MRSTFVPEIIYGIFDRMGFPVLRIDRFDKGNYAEIRTELKFSDFLTTDQLQDIVLKLNVIEQNENILIQVVNIDMAHQSMRLNIMIKDSQKKDDNIKIIGKK